jgi:hypothetical protein
LNGRPYSIGALHPREHVVLHEEVQVALVPVGVVRGAAPHLRAAPVGERVGGVLDGPDHLAVALVALVEHVGPARQQRVLAAADHRLRVVGRPGEVAGLAAGEVHLGEQVPRGALRGPPVVGRGLGEVRLGERQVLEDGPVDLGAGRARGLRRRVGGLLERQVHVAEELHEVEVVERPEEARLGDAARLHPLVHRHLAGAAHHGVGGVDPLVHEAPHVAHVVVAGVELRRVVVEVLEVAVRPLGERVDAVLGEREPALAPVELAREAVGGAHQVLVPRRGVEVRGRHARDDLLVQVGAARDAQGRGRQRRGERGGRGLRRRAAAEGEESHRVRTRG